MDNIKKSYIREILKVTSRDDIISFAGGLPNPSFFPVDNIIQSSIKVLNNDGPNVLQYSTTEGYLPLRQFIAQRYYADLDISADNIIITNGSQQGLDLVCKTFIDKGDAVLVEKPGYLGAIQALSMFESKLYAIPLLADGVDEDELYKALSLYNPKLFYAVANFQNPTGNTYTKEKRSRVADIMKKYSTVVVEDNPYGELRFKGESLPSMKYFMGDQVIALGSFSKVFSPSMRLGWICASEDIIDKMLTLKQASDLHTNYFSQRVLYQYLQDNDFDEHVNAIIDKYRQQKDFMVKMLKKLFPKDVVFTDPDGGMFLWVTLPEGMSVIKLLEKAFEKNVAFVPGAPFYIDAESDPGNTFRLNYTNTSEDEIERGIERLVEAMNEIF